MEHFHTVSFDQLCGWPFVPAHQFGVDGHGDPARPKPKGADNVGDRGPLAKLERLLAGWSLAGVGWLAGLPSHAPRVYRTDVLALADEPIGLQDGEPPGLNWVGVPNLGLTRGVV